MVQEGRLARWLRAWSDGGGGRSSVTENIGRFWFRLESHEAGRDKTNVICPLTCCAAQQSDGRNEHPSPQSGLSLVACILARKKEKSRVLLLTVSGRGGCYGDSNDDESGASPWILCAAAALDGRWG